MTKYKIGDGYIYKELQLNHDEGILCRDHGKVKVDELFYTSIDNDTNVNWPLYKMTLYKERESELECSKISVSNASASTYLSQKSLSRRWSNTGAELKLAYFHDFADGLMFGIDLTGTVSSKNSKNVNVGNLGIDPNDYNWVLSGENKRLIATANRDGSNSSAAENAFINVTEPLSLSQKLNLPNQDIKVTTDPAGVDFIDTSSSKELSFEKDVFSPKLAFVVGKTFGKWFTGLRTGFSYTTGRIKTADMTNSKTVSITSPCVGVHVMRQLSNNTHMYMTADWNLTNGGRNSVDMHGIKNFKHSSYNISAGITWRGDLIK